MLATGRRTLQSRVAAAATVGATVAVQVIHLVVNFENKRWVGEESNAYGACGPRSHTK